MHGSDKKKNRFRNEENEVSPNRNISEFTSLSYTNSIQNVSNILSHRAKSSRQLNKQMSQGNNTKSGDFYPQKVRSKKIT